MSSCPPHLTHALFKEKIELVLLIVLLKTWYEENWNIYFVNADGFCMSIWVGYFCIHGLSYCYTIKQCNYGEQSEGELINVNILFQGVTQVIELGNPKDFENEAQDSNPKY